MRPSYDDLLLEAMTLGATVEERTLQHGLCGFYWDRERTIVIDDGMADWQKRCVLCHELSHARYHDAGCGTNCSKAERRARKETALRLISPLEYASAEAAYDGDAFLIASDLGVTVQVLNDYRMWLDNNVRA
ncbi:hypothetical protein BACT_0525 [Bifidobacterium actinocoloniiforme DSM 22766]|uniref:IrrE N-terminal-like domain-containing protein n=2 Tax=Bifidobacterium actinocoloniiforme TaxID=638619 RepID=A0A086YZX4_9BIFI|nr:hypothetical protein BACT_0525 [Bifidobacterium actinocoloniiforme DSM 22766]